jgi:hypothetical protein
MLLTNLHWEAIKDRFDPMEKARIADIIYATSMNPKGKLINERKLPQELRKKLLNLLGINKIEEPEVSSR